MCVALTSVYSVLVFYGSEGLVMSIGVNRPAIVREIPHFGLLPAFPHFCQNVLHFWLYFEITKKL